jgi:hypothetical protein
MRTVVVALALASALLAGASVFFVLAKSGSAPATDTARLDATAAEVADLGRRIARLEQALRIGGERGGEPAAVVGRAAAAGAASDASGAAKEGAPEAAAEDDPAVAAVLEKAGKGAGAELRALVRQVIADERTEREVRSREEAEARMREFEELGKGPYGKYNRRINTLAGKLGLHESQMQRYHDLLVKYDGQGEELRRGLAAGDPEAQRRYRDDFGKLSSEFDEQAKLLLNGEQVEAYEKLHTFEKSLATAGGGAGFISFSVNASGDGGPAEDVVVSPMTIQVDHGEGAIEVIGGAAGVESVPMPLPADAPVTAPAPRK